MLSSISWQHYLAAIIILTVSYYGYVLLRYYQKEISNWFNRKQNNPTLFSTAQAMSSNVMGAAKLDNGVSLFNSEDLSFAESSADDEHMAISEENDNVKNVIPISPSQELELEAGNLIAAFQAIDNKPEFITLLQILINSYKRFKDEIELPATLNRIVELSKKKLLFPLTLTDLQECWA